MQSKVCHLLFLVMLLSQAAQSRNLKYLNVPEVIQSEIAEKYQVALEAGLNLAQIDEIIRAIHLKTNNEIIEAYQERDQIVIHLVRSTRVRRISIQGNTAHSDSQLKMLLGFSEGDILETDLVLEGAEKIRKYYSETGFLNATVNVEIPDSKDQNINVDISINESVPTRIKSLDIKTTNLDLKTILTKKLKKFEKDFFTEGLVQNIRDEIKDYFKDQMILQGEIVKIDTSFADDDSTVALAVYLTNTNKFILDFDGYSEFSRSRLMKVLDVENYISTNPNVAAELAFRLKSFYLSKGYARSEVRSETQETKKFERKVVFRITEGPQILIEKIVFQGNYKKEIKFYEELFRTVSEEINLGKIYVRESVEKIIANLEIEMQNQGFLAFDIPSFRTIFNTTKDKISLYINLEEGPQTLVDTLELEGNNNISEEVLVNLIGLRKDQPLELSKLEKSISTIKTFYQEQGFLEVAILNERDTLVAYNKDNTKAKLLYQISEGPKVKVASIATEGNLFSKDEIILIELEFKKGDILTPAKIEESILRLQKTGYFNTVDIRTLEQRTNVSDRTVIVKVTEREPGIFTLGFGATNERNGTLRGYSGLGYRNIKGTGRGISARLEGNYNIADIKYPELKVIFGYVEPYLFKSRLRGRVNVSRARYVDELNEKQGVESNQYNYSIEKDFTSHITGIFKLYQLEQFRDFMLRDNADTSDVNETNQTLTQQNIASIGPTLDIDFRDNPFLPTKGIFSRVDFEYASPSLGSSSSIEYYRFTSSLTHYWPLVKNWVWAHNVRYGYLKNLNNNVNGGIPYSKRGFILGGRSTIRGFEYNAQEVIPNNKDLGVDKITNYFLKTSAQQFLFKSEIRFPLYGNIYGGVFYDGGSVKIKDLVFADDYRDSVGIGLRYNTAFGAFNMEIGKKLDQKENESDVRYHLSFGTF